MLRKLVLLRHGESIWNFENRFTGWTDVDLTKKGLQEAKYSGEILNKEEIKFDLVYTSVLKRAILTTKICLKNMNLLNVPIIYDWHLNERHYGALQGLNKKETAAKFGADQVQIWRRSYDTPPPPLKLNDKRHPRFDKLYNNVNKSNLPSSESLKDTESRFLPFWRKEICPNINNGKNVLIVAHGNSLRSLIKNIDQISDKEITSLNIPTGIPLIYEFDQELRPIKKYYIGDQKNIKKKIMAIEQQININR